MPLILGRPFLAFAGAVLDLMSSRISLRHVDPGVFYPANPDVYVMWNP